MKERLSATLTKMLKGKEKSWQNSARENGSTFSGLTSVTAGKDADADIWRCIETIEFDFGHKRYTTKEAGLIFVYETGFGMGEMYVIALSENCGTIVFYIPDDLFELITERAGELMCSAGKYIADLIELHNAFSTVIESSAGAGITTDEAVCAVGMLKEAMESATYKAAAASEALTRFGNAIYSAYAPDVRERKANNWLKMHGFPMRRKGKGRKHHE